MKHKIEILSPEISNKIAAGEVVQRPLSVVKELVENSIDANGKNIKIKLKNSGLDEIQIQDDGIGMDFENVSICLLRHATSKVKEENDIYNIMTLGFRGEALPSIAAVSKFNLTTSTDGTFGYELIKEGDEPQEIKKVPANIGTQITVSNLFYNTPARFKHLSSTFYELSLIIQFINKAALTNPFIKFELINNDNTIFSSLGDGNIINVMHKIYTSEIAKNILEFTKSNEDFKVDFYIVKPQFTRSKKNNIHIGVNGRIIRNLAIENMIIKGYGSYLHTNQFPIVYLSITTESSLIDINIHPTKEQIKIALINKLEELIVNSIKEELNKQEYIYHSNISDRVIAENEDTLRKEEISLLDKLFKEQKEEENDKSNQEESQKENEQENQKVISQNEEEVVQTNDIKEEVYQVDNNQKGEKKEVDSLSNEGNINKLDDKIKDDLISDSNKVVSSSKSSPSMLNEDQGDEVKSNLGISKEGEEFIDEEKSIIEDSDEDIKIEGANKLFEKSDIVSKSEIKVEDKVTEQTLIQGGVYIGIHHKTYIMYENEKGLYFVDQHAAQERINYEKILKTLSSKKYNFQKVLLPMMFDFTQDEFLLIEDKLEELVKYGLVFEKFGHNTLRLVEVDTSYLKIENMKKQIRWIIDMVAHENKLKYSQIVDEIAISMACKASIKAHQYISQEDAEKLLLELSKCYEPYTCPHGRPIIVNLDNYQIQKMFKRVN